MFARPMSSLESSPPPPSDLSPPPAAIATSWLAVLSRPGPALLLLLLCSSLVLLPGIGSFGLWDPHEVRLVEGASDPIAISELWKPANAMKPRLPLVPIKLGLKLLGTGELGARLPMALVAMLLLATLVLHGVVSRQVRSSLLGGLVLLTTPALFLGARQASLHLLPMTAQLLSLIHI